MRAGKPVVSHVFSSSPRDPPSSSRDAQGHEDEMKAPRARVYRLDCRVLAFWSSAGTPRQPSVSQATVSVNMSMEVQAYQS